MLLNEIIGKSEYRANLELEKGAKKPGVTAERAKRWAEYQKKNKPKRKLFK